MNLRQGFPLDDLQEAFQDYLVTPETGLAIQSHVIGNAQASAEFRLRIYAEAYRLRLEEALETDFEGVHALLGDEQFHTLCLRYIAAHPSSHYSLRYFGRHMAGFLRTAPHYAEQGVLAELAGFEWSLVDAFDAPDDPVLGVAEMAGFSPEAWPYLCFELHPSVQQLSLAWNAPQIWAALKAQRVPPAPEKLPAAQDWLVWRQDYQSYYRPLDRVEAAALRCVRGGGNFAELCVELPQRMAEHETAAAAAGFLHRWISDGLVREVSGDTLL